MTIIAGDVFSAFKATGVDDESKRAAAEVGDIKELTQEIKERLGAPSLTHMRWPPQHNRDRLARHRRRRVRPGL